MVQERDAHMQEHVWNRCSACNGTKTAAPTTWNCNKSPSLWHVPYQGWLTSGKYYTTTITATAISTCCNLLQLFVDGPQLGRRELLLQLQLRHAKSLHLGHGRQWLIMGARPGCGALPLARVRRPLPGGTLAIPLGLAALFAEEIHGAQHCRWQLLPPDALARRNPRRTCVD
jgi:hypothetical protein